MADWRWVVNETATESITTEVSEPAEKKRGLKKTTLVERGPELALGIADPSGKLHRNIELRRWNLKKEKELGELRKEEPDVSLGEYVSMVLAEMCTWLGPHDFDKKSMNQAEKRLVLSQMWMGDVLHAYCWRRLKAMGHELKTRLECPFHEYKFPWTGDLRTLEVNVAESLEDAMWEFVLSDPFEIREQTVEKFKLGPVRWHAIEKAELGRRVNPGKVKAVMIHASIHEIGGAEVALGEHELDEMSKLDLETHIAEIDRHAIGPDMRIEPRCDHKRCERSFETSIDWSYDNFFSVSSR